METVLYNRIIFDQYLSKFILNDFILNDFVSNALFRLFHILGTLTLKEYFLKS